MADYPVFLPRTDFPMRGDLPAREPEILARWDAMGLYDKVRTASAGRPRWVLHWGPPYANGHIHIGHAFTKSLKDTVNRSMQMAGRDAPLVPGWDCHGLPIEWKVEEAWRAQGRDKDADPLAFRAACRDFAAGWVAAQRGEMRRLGVLADWDNAYLTMDPANEAAILEEIYKVADAGLLYRGEKPVMWSSVEKTALAEAEVEYKEHKSTAVWVKFPIVKAADPDLIGANIVIWTTTPWTIPGNRAVAFNPDLPYALYETEDGARLVLCEALAREDYQKIRPVGDLEGIVCAHPLRDLPYPPPRREGGPSSPPPRRGGGRGGVAPVRTGPKWQALLNNAKEMRNALTPAETKLWTHLRAGQTGHSFRKQYPIYPYIADFACPERGLIVEVDGDTHTPDTAEHDAERTIFLEARGFRVIRFSNREVLENPEGVTETIRHALREDPPLTPPSARGGRYAFDVPLLPAEFVTAETGTGFVHIAPGHGVDDHKIVNLHNFSFEISRKIKKEQKDKKLKNKEVLYAINNVIKRLKKNISPTDKGITVYNTLHIKYMIPIASAVDGDGYYTDAHPLFAGKQVFANELHKAPERDADIAVIKALAAAGALLAKASYRHDYPHSWRSGAPVLFRTTPQWFIAMDKTLPPREEGGVRGGSLRAKALEDIDKTRFVPPQGQNRIRAMVAQRPDWCISRQRAWGVPIALFVRKGTGEILNDSKVKERILEAFRQDGADAWWARDPADFLGPEYNVKEYEQVFDIVDVWFESGATHAFVLEKRGLPWPADLYLEGSDQHRGWFQSSLLESCATRGAAPYKAVLTHGFIVDQKGYKMSKSRGNVLAPEDLIQRYGADIIRLWAITVDYRQDVPVGDVLLKSVADLYRRLRGTLRFLLGALDGYTPAERVPVEQMPALERYMLARLAALDAQIAQHQKAYAFGTVAHALHQFCNADLSAFYLDIRKDCLYCDAPDDPKRRACRTVLATLFDALVTRMAPILPFTTEEAWVHRPPGVFAEADSVHLRTYAAVDPAWQDPALEAKWAKLRDLRRVVLGAIEPYRKAKAIGSSLEAAPVVHITQDWKDALQNVDLDEVCITSAAPVALAPAPQGAFVLEGVPGVAVTFATAPGTKCARCWKVLPEVEGDLCPRCALVVGQKGV